MLRNNTYKVVVQASDGDMSSHFKVTVNVQDKEEEGSVKLRPDGSDGRHPAAAPGWVSITAHSVTDLTAPCKLLIAPTDIGDCN